MQTPAQYMAEEEARLLGGIWEELQRSARSGRLDAAGMRPADIDRLNRTLFTAAAAVVHGAFVTVADALA